jgi:hypothetical protein
VTYDDYEPAARQVRERGGTLQGRPLSVDQPEYRYRLWSVKDNPLFYYLSRMESSRAMREEDIKKFFAQGQD